MSQEVDDIIRRAISNKEIVEFFYHGHMRTAEPHVYGRLDGRSQLLVFQIGGGSSSGALPDWRRVQLAEVSGLRTTGQKFAGPRPNPSGRHSPFDEVLATVG